MHSIVAERKELPARYKFRAGGHSIGEPSNFRLLPVAHGKDVAGNLSRIASYEPDASDGTLIEPPADGPPPKTGASSD
ncbi:MULTISPECIES: hypothetical protein [Bradyrhizobium]|uniref:hypothetical protein n=1 Tax=Bradyrhizobium TaxID=374 RepID=UPI00211E47F1|nr:MULTISPECIES: hypothetical protein [Bradyrhizobium]